MCYCRLAFSVILHSIIRPGCSNGVLPRYLFSTQAFWMVVLQDSSAHSTWMKRVVSVFDECCSSKWAFVFESSVAHIAIPTRMWMEVIKLWAGWRNTTKKQLGSSSISEWGPRKIRNNLRPKRKSNQTTNTRPPRRVKKRKSRSQWMATRRNGENSRYIRICREYQ